MVASSMNRAQLLRLAVVLSFGAAVSLGLARFSYALLLPPMRSDLGWNYLVSGAMNTLNAAGYLLGALVTPAMMRAIGARATMLAGGVVTSLVLAGHGLTSAAWALGALRLAAGVASAWMFVSGGLMAARLGARCAELPAGQTLSPGLILGMFYGGTGLGIVACSVFLPGLQLHEAQVYSALQLDVQQWRAWQVGWLVLAVLAAVATLLMVGGLPADPPDAAATTTQPVPRRSWLFKAFGFGLAGYFMFGVGYIGYMTFIVTLLREQQMPPQWVAVFYAVLGLGVMASPWLWAWLLQRYRGGQALASLSLLLALATAMPVLSTATGVAYLSGALFGGVFLSVVASTTAMVRHNLPAAQWPAGIAMFTIVFAVGQIIGPTLIGMISDHGAGLRGGFVVSALTLLIGAGLAMGQRPLKA